MTTVMIISGIHDLAPGDLLHNKLEDYFAAGAGAGAQVLLDPQKVKVPSETVLTFITAAPTRI